MNKLLSGIFVIVLFLSCGKELEPVSPKNISFGKSVRVNVTGYNGDIMEPFISRDGRFLFFNNLNNPAINTNLYYASKINDSTFNYIEEIQGINTEKLDAVASCDSNNNLYFISLQNINSYSTVYRANFISGNNYTAESVPGIERGIYGGVYFDSEISYYGKYLLLSEGKYDESNLIEADIYIAEQTGSSFHLISQDILKNINTENNLEYAACTSKDMLELYFTRVNSSVPHIYISTRNSLKEVFGEPHRIETIDGFAEAPALSPEGNILYYHKLEDDKFALYMVRKISK